MGSDLFSLFWSGNHLPEDEKDSGFVLSGGCIGRLTACAVDHLFFCITINAAVKASDLVVVEGAEGVAGKHADISVLLN